MKITEFDSPLDAEDARKISLNNKDDSTERSHFRKIMQEIRFAASFGYTRYVSPNSIRERVPNETVQKALRSLGYRVIEKRAYQWDEVNRIYSDKPLLSDQRETFFLEITWG